MTIAQEFASRFAALNTDDDTAVLRFEEDIYGAAQMIPVDPEDEHCTDYLYVFKDGSAVSDNMKVAAPDTVRELQELQRQWEEFRREWFFNHPGRDRRCVFDRAECAGEFRKSVLGIRAD
jgi:hypothetical protein